MNVTTMTMPRKEARKKLNQYRQAVAQKRGAALSATLRSEYEAAILGYKAMADGTPLILMPDVIQAGGFDDQMRPNLALARADRAQVHLTWAPGETSCLFDTRAERTAHFYPSLQQIVELGREHGVKYGDRNYGKYVSGHALVPMIPPDCRPPSGQLKDHFVLWEVEQWADKPQIAISDRDPYLVKHIGGDLWAILAEWDLTDLERAVMAGRSTQA